MKCKQVIKLLNVTHPTLCSYVKKGKLKVKRQVNGFYDYDDDSVFALLGITERSTVVYGRVSTPGQKSSLKNQIEIAVQFANANGYKVSKTYSDIASGLTFDRGDFKEMIKEVIEHRIKNIIVTHKDRFSRVSFDMWKELCSEFGCNIIVMNEEEDDDKGIFEDIISLLHCFSMRMYSKRRKKKLELIENDLINEEECD